ncbi:MAG: hypothetical protein BWY69_01685 [Planctomycetes bacterium ADurb.Bin401]|nr:MAG: hypothetical protein BWY69_01685 [Planctomycetes bacterium ADurb.Bin401]
MGQVNRRIIKLEMIPIGFTMLNQLWVNLTQMIANLFFIVPQRISKSKNLKPMNWLALRGLILLMAIMVSITVFADCKIHPQIIIRNFGAGRCR